MGDPVPSTVAALKQGQIVPFPDAALNRFAMSQQADMLVSVQSVVVDPKDHLGVLDPGSIKFGLTLRRTSSIDRWKSFLRKRCLAFFCSGGPYQGFSARAEVTTLISCP